MQTFIILIVSLLQKHQDIRQSECIGSNIEYAIDGYERSSRWNDNAPQFFTHLFLGIYLGLSIYESYCILNKTKEYNNKLYKNIFGINPPAIKASLYPLQDGAGISLTYSFN